MKRAATLLLVPVALCGGIGLLCFGVMLVLFGWPEPQNWPVVTDLLLALGLPTLLVEAVMLAVIVGTALARRWRRGRPARPPVPLSRTMLRYWWTPAVAAPGLLVPVVVFAKVFIADDDNVQSIMEQSGWSADSGDLLGRALLILLVLLYLLALSVFLAQLATDRAQHPHPVDAGRP